MKLIRFFLKGKVNLKAIHNLVFFLKMRSRKQHHFLGKQESLKQKKRHRLLSKNP